MNLGWWLIAVLFYMGQAWVSNKQNLNGGYWFWIAVFYSALPVWPLIAKASKNLLIDGMIYDVVLFFSYALTLMFLGCAKAFTAVQWMGFALVMVGFLLLKARI
jgi:hypothetical protein